MFDTVLNGLVRRVLDEVSEQRMIHSIAMPSCLLH